MMQITLVNRNDVYGGAARATLRLHEELLKHNIDSLLISDKIQGSPPRSLFKKNLKNKVSQKTRDYINQIPLKVKGYSPKHTFSPNFIGKNIFKMEQIINSDIIHLNWINGGFVNLKHLIGYKKPIVWTLHDVWPFTGGCHLLLNCNNFTTGCGHCPQLESKVYRDISRLTVENKLNIFKELNITFVAPSKWMKDSLEQSEIFINTNNNVEIIPNGLDLEEFKRIDKKMARIELGLPLDKKIILFGAVNATSDPNKGFEMLKESLKVISEKGDSSLLLAIFGSDDSYVETDITKNVGIKTINIGKVNSNKKLINLYSAADVMCVPSKQESFGQTALESLACGTPVVAYKTTGLLDIVDHKMNGYLADCFNTTDYSNGIQWVLDEVEKNQKINIVSRDKVTTYFDIKETTKKHIQLYKNLIQNNK